MNLVFVLDQTLPVYNGPISTSMAQEVAFKFSGGTGLLWTIQPDLVNKFKLTTGIDVTWISCHREEEEVLLMNQYLPITATENFDNDLNNTVNHLLYTIKSYRKEITDPNSFYKIMGLQYNNEDINRDILQLDIDDYVQLEEGKSGVVKFIGKTSFANGEMVGLLSL